ncbi:MAG: archease [Methanoregulaceae archaeon]|nr:archease [Methanoregulaceae archaeon]
MTYEELDHTADVKVRVKARSLEDLFSESVRALMEVMYVACTTGDEVVREVEVTADGEEELIHDFLSEVLFLSVVDNIVFCNVSVNIHGFQVHGKLLGEYFSPGRHLGGTEVKGISYNDLRLFREGEFYVLDILFDV